jgi:hypothetical protein
MRNEPREISLAEYRKLTEGGRKPRGRTTRPDIPSAPKGVRTGLTTLLAPTRASGHEAWSYAVVGDRYRLYVIGEPTMDTGWQASEVAAVNAAKELSR